MLSEGIRNWWVFLVADWFEHTNRVRGAILVSSIFWFPLLVFFTLAEVLFTSLGWVTGGFRDC